MQTRGAAGGGVLTAGSTAEDGEQGRSKVAGESTGGRAHAEASVDSGVPGCSEAGGWGASECPEMGLGSFGTPGFLGSILRRSKRLFIERRCMRWSEDW